MSVLGYGVFQEPLALDPGRVTGRVVSWNVFLLQTVGSRTELHVQEDGTLGQQGEVICS